MNRRIYTLVFDTCKAIVSGSEEFRKGLIKQINDFLNGAEFRTTDVIPSIQIFLAQILVLGNIEGIQDQIQLSKQNLQLLFRFAFEEEFRRNISKASKEAIIDDQVIDLLFHDHKGYFDSIIDAKKTEITTEIMSQLMSGVD